MNLRYAALIAMLIPALGACTSTPSNSGDNPDPCPNGHEFHNDLQNLGSSSRLIEEFRNSASRNESTTLIDITRAAGMSDNWDRMTAVFPNMSATTLNDKAGTEGCWKNLPQIGSGSPQFGYYVFIKDKNVVQVAQWMGQDGPLKLRGYPSLTSDSVLVPQHFGDVSRLVPAP